MMQQAAETATGVGKVRKRRRVKRMKLKKNKMENEGEEERICKRLSARFNAAKRAARDDCLPHLDTTSGMLGLDIASFHVLRRNAA
ncbi:unnamed protein product [Gongylonema pulchrum]|uniref:Uncharacterized protein n=1 Tax=Gongylonema pulchrum TaxID=637853 RepID=A0A183E005_9BILA|nr:unnamed protein product [Gongylonema pulchrum]